MKNQKKLIVPILSIAILLVSLAIMLCDILVPLSIWVHPVLTFLFCAFIGFGTLSFALGFIKKSPWFFFVGAILVGLALIYALSNYIAWWITLIVVVVIWIVFAILSFMSCGSVEDIAKNNNPEYKTYEQRKAENVENNNKKEEKELPKIKSFKE